MTKEECEKIGSTTVIRIILITILIGETYWMLTETSGDFANGFLFYIDHHSNILVILFYILLFGTSYFFGQQAGKQILLSNKNSVKVGLKSGTLSSSLIGSYVFMGLLIGNRNLVFVSVFISLVFILEIIVWLLAVFYINKRRVAENQSSKND